MDKRACRQVPVMVAVQEDISLAKRVKAAKYIAKSDVRLCGHKKTLLLYLFPAAEMRMGKAEAAYRVFLTHDDYITQDLRSKSVRWLTGQLCSFAWSYEDYSNKDWITFADDKSVKRVEQFYKSFQKSGDPIEIIIKFQEKVLMDRKMVRYKKIIAKIDKRMKAVPALPHGWKHWVEESALYESRYIFYKYRDRKLMEGYCTHCHHDVKVEHPHHGKPGICPRCGSQITFKAIGRSIKILDQKKVTLVQRTGDTFIFRGFSVYKNYAVNYKNPILSVYEDMRVFSNRQFQMKDEDCFSYGHFRPDYDVVRWKDDANAGVYYDSVIYPKNLKQIFKGTKLQYSSLWTMLEAVPGKALNILSFMDYKPCYEYLIKMGLYRLVRSDCNGYEFLPRDAKNINDVLGVPKSWISELKQMNPSMDELQLFRAAYRAGKQTTADEVKKIECIVGPQSDIFSLNVSTTHKILKYFKPMIHDTWQGHNASDFFSLWKDYIGFCKGLKWNLKNEFVLFPKDLKKAHDDAMNLWTEKKNEAVDQGIKELCPQYKNRFNWEYEDLMMIVPRCAADIRDEAHQQHNCVATYIEKMAKRETVILFLRKKAQPKKSYYTVEYREGRVVQCRCFGNGDMTKEVKSAIRKFERDMAARTEKAKIGAGAA